MITREFNGLDAAVARRDYVVVEYAGNDTLYVPSDQIDALSRYQGGETPALMSLGGAQWERAKNRVRAAVREMAAELIRLYAARMHAPGRAFAPDGQMQAALEDAFAFVETPDQLQVADEVKRDMEAPIPMDRLISGDVGFGKTEVAVRAAGKAVFDGTQVICASILRGAGDTRVPAILHALSFWAVGIPLGALLAFTFKLGAAGLWWGLTAGLAAAAVLQLQRVRLKLGRDLARVVIDAR
jgi:hypothetical protein